MAELNLSDQSEVAKSLPANETSVKGNYILDSKGSILLILGSNREALLVQTLIEQYHINSARIDRAVGMLQSGDDRVLIDELLDDLISKVAQTVGATRGITDSYNQLTEFTERAEKCVGILDEALK